MAYLVDVSILKNKEKKQKLFMHYYFMSRLALFEDDFRKLNEQKAQIPNHMWKWWIFSIIPPFDNFNCSAFKLKKFINRYYSNQHKIWNASFFYGMSVYGILRIQNSPQILFKQKTLFAEKSNLLKIIQDCPFKVKTKTYISKSNKARFNLYDIYPLLMEKSEKSISFMAGVFALGHVVKMNKDRWVRYGSMAKKIFQEWKIPIEFEDSYKRIYISPFWPAMLEDYMPECARIFSKAKLRKGYKGKTHLSRVKANEYAAILWRAYCPYLIYDLDIPFMLKRRAVFKNFCDEKLATSPYLQQKRFEYKLMNLDVRFKHLIHEKYQLKLKQVSELIQEKTKESNLKNNEVPFD